MSRPYRNDDDSQVKKRMVVYCILVASLVVLGFLYFLYKNNEERHKRLAAETKEQQRELEELKAQNDELKELGVGENNLRSEDLDFWDMYEQEKEPEAEPEDHPKPYSATKKEESKTEKEEKEPSFDDTDEAESAEPEGEEENPAAGDGRHIGITDAAGNTVYYEIMDNVPKNEYTFASNLEMQGGRLSYRDGDLNAEQGIAVSKAQGTIDWAKVKADGINFAMVKVAYRGYESGLISLDESFVANARGAVANGIPIGAYFSTQAINETEAVEEANFTIGAIAQYGITYPVALYLENIKNDSTRTDNLSMAEKTDLARKYLETIESFGFKPVIYADRTTLIRDIDLSELSSYAIFLIDPVNDELAREAGFSVTPTPTPAAVSPVPVWSGAVTPTPTPSPAPGSASTVTTNITSFSQRDNSSTKKDPAETSMNKGDEKEQSVTGSSAGRAEKKSWYTDFPYRFSLWQYRQSGSVSGVAGTVPLVLGFTDYSKR